MSRRKVELYKSIARKISTTRFPPLHRHRSAPESIYNSRMTVHRVLHIPSVTYRRYRETITHSYVLYFSLSLSLESGQMERDRGVSSKLLHLRSNSRRV